MGPRQTSRALTLRYGSLMLENNESDLLMHAERPIADLLVKQIVVLL